MRRVRMAAAWVVVGVVAGAVTSGCGVGGPGPVRRTASAKPPWDATRAKRAVLAPEDIGAGWTAGALRKVRVPAHRPKRTAGAAGGHGKAACERQWEHGLDPVLPTVDARRKYSQDGSDVTLTAEVTAYTGDGAAREIASVRALLDACRGVRLPWEKGVVAEFSEITVARHGYDVAAVRIAYLDNGGENLASVADMAVVHVAGGVATLTFSSGTSSDPATFDRLTRKAAGRLTRFA